MTRSLLVGLLPPLLAVVLLCTPFFSQDPQEIEIERYLQEARAAEQSKNFEQSAEAYQQILKIRPKWALIHQSLGVVRHLQSRYPEAITALEQALKLEPSLWGSHLFLGMDYYRTNQFLKAIPSLEQSIKLNPKLAENEARFWLGSSYLALERFDEALEQFRRLAELKPRDLEALFSLAQAYTRFATALFTRISEMDPESAEAHRLQGEWFEWQEKAEEAIAEYLVVARLRPDWEGMRLAVGKLYFKNGDFRNAARQFEEELRIAPGDESARRLLTTVRQKLSANEPTPPPRASLGQSSIDSPGSTAANPKSSDPLSRAIEAFREREFEKANALLARVVRENPSNALAKLYLARCHFSKGEFEKSVPLLQSLEQADNHQLEALFWRGKSYQELAALTLQNMIDIDPVSYRVHQLSGELLEDRRKYAEAISAYQKALKQSADLMGIRFAIGNACWKMQQMDEALTWLKDELARNPYHALANYRVGSIYAAKGNIDEGIPFLEKAVQANPGMTVAQQELAKAFLAQERYEEAIAKLRTLADAAPEDESIRYLLSGAYKKAGKLEKANAELQIFTQLHEKKSRQRRENLQKRVSTGTGSAPTGRNP